MRLHQSILIFLCYCYTTLLLAQPTFPKNGVYDERDDHYALTNATIYMTPTQKLENATLIIKKGKVVAVGKNIKIPKDAVQIDLQGKYIYPSFIELSSDYGIQKEKAFAKVGSQSQKTSNKSGAYSWNEALRPEIAANELFKVDDKAAEEYRQQGFGTVLSHQHNGMARGSSALVLLGNDTEHEMIIRPRAAAHYSFSKGTSTMSYPSSRMGGIALLRQAYYDGQWYAKAPAADKEYNISLEQWNALQDENLPQFFETTNRLDLLRADKIGDEFGVQYIFRASGDEYLRLDAIKQTQGAVLIPFNFPKAYDVNDIFDAEELSLEQMKHWELAPTNPAKVAASKIPFAVTLDGMEDKKEFWKMARKAYQFGLTEADLLAALTTTPAQLIGASDQIGTLEVGKLANFIITSANLLQEKTIIHQNWIKGKAYVVKDWQELDIRGKYDLQIAEQTYLLGVEGTVDAPELYLRNVAPDTSKTDSIPKEDKGKKLKYTLENNRISFAIPSKDTSKKKDNIFRLSGNVELLRWSGQATDPEGNWLTWTAVRQGDTKLDTLKMPELDTSEMGELVFPFSGYGHTADKLPQQETILIQNVTVWTGEKDGILTETDVLIQAGKIKKIGKQLPTQGIKTVDGTGKHLTAGIIDEHSHICINYGVNEGTQASSAEVRIGDVLNSEDINMYRQLAGGVVAAQLLHGSANPIGGQSAIIKFRWGQLPEALKINNTAGFIKFALGENVKQSNWGSNATSRFPQTRMGVEQVYEDHFTRANEYKIALSKGELVRKDLELDALVEILEKQRFISCHSYVQSEITMLMRVAEKYDFKLNTFTHILEGYKVADKMKAHGAGASTFSDWWAYKYEVLDAIPYNAKVLHDMGIVVAINSDDAEMGRRLNQEAAKSVKYGGMSEEAAWNMVTINPAKLLHIDNRTGSIKVGKDADIVLWTDNPLSIYAKAQKTFVDGICLFDLQEDQAKRATIQSERNRLIQKMIHAKGNGAETQPPMREPKHHYHCGDVDCNEFIDFNVDLNQSK